MDLYEAIEIICDDYCKYPDVYSGNQLADKCDMCPFNKCEELRWADRKTESNSEKLNNCETCEHYKLTCDLFSEICKYEPKDEPQTDCYKLINEVVKLDMSREDKFKVMELLERHCEKCKHYLQERSE